MVIESNQQVNSYNYIPGMFTWQNHKAQHCYVCGEEPDPDRDQAES